MTTIDFYRSTTLDSYNPPFDLAQKKLSSKATNYIPPAVPSPPLQNHRRESPPRRPPTIADPPDLEMASEEFSQWYFTETELDNTPSILHGISAVEERCRRAKGVNFILQAGMILKLPQVTLGCASVFFHRFYMRHSMIDAKGGIHHYNIAATSLFLATKSEENCRKTKEIVIAVAKVAQKNASHTIDEQSKEYWRWRDSILLYEELMLEQLTFDVVLQSPYNLLISFLLTFGLEKNKSLRNAAWSFINDSIMTPLCLSLPPKDIAIAALFFGAKLTGDVIPDVDGLPWWEYLGGRPGKIGKALIVMNEFWTDNPLKKEFPHALSPAASWQGEDLDRTRAKTQPRSSGEMTPLDESISQNVLAPNPPTANGHTTAALPPSQPEEQGGEPSASRNGTQESSPGLKSPKLNLSGSSDVIEKAAANDPATHEHTEPSNVSQPSMPEQKTTPKRKALDEEDEPEPSAKRRKSDGAEDATGVSQTSEEGEVEA